MNRTTRPYVPQPEVVYKGCAMQEDTRIHPKDISTPSRLENIHRTLEDVKQVLGDMEKLQIKGDVLQTMSKTNKTENDARDPANDENPITMDVASFDVKSLSDAKLDVGQLIEMDRGLQHLEWMKTIQMIGQQVSLVGRASL